MSWNNYSYTNPGPARKPGIYRCLILSAEQTESKSSGLPMLRITFRPSGTTANVNAYIVGNDYFDDNFSRFLDAFPRIKDEKLTKDECGYFRGALGCVKLILDDNGYFKAAKYPWVTPFSCPDLPPFKWVPREDDPKDPPEFLSISLEELNDTAGGEMPF